MKTQSRSISALTTKSGFTLVELMVSIVIVVILASFVFLGTSRLRESTNQAVSIDNLKKLQLANGLYATDNNGRFAPCWFKKDDGSTGGVWDRNSDFLDYYIGPSEPTPGKDQQSRVDTKNLDPIAYRAKGSGYDTLKASYGMISKEPYSSSGPGVESVYRLSELTTPAKTAAFVTSVNWLVQYGARFQWDGVEGKVNATRIAYRHRNKALVAYYDGHVGTVTKDDMKAFDKRGGKNNSFWKGNNGRP